MTVASVKDKTRMQRWCIEMLDDGVAADQLYNGIAVPASTAEAALAPYRAAVGQRKAGQEFARIIGKVRYSAMAAGISSLVGGGAILISLGFGFYYNYHANKRFLEYNATRGLLIAVLPLTFQAIAGIVALLGVYPAFRLWAGNFDGIYTDGGCATTTHTSIDASLARPFIGGASILVYVQFLLHAVALVVIVIYVSYKDHDTSDLTQRLKSKYDSDLEMAALLPRASASGFGKGTARKMSYAH